MQAAFLGLPLPVVLALCALVVLTMILGHLMLAWGDPAVVRPAEEADARQARERSEP